MAHDIEVVDTRATKEPAGHETPGMAPVQTGRPAKQKRGDPSEHEAGRRGQHAGQTSERAHARVQPEGQAAEARQPGAEDRPIAGTARMEYRVKHGRPAHPAPA